MGTYLLDSAGTPIIDPQGRLMAITGNAEFRQRIINVFCTQKFAETLAQDYGFNYADFLRSIGPVSPDIALRTAVMDALNPRTVQDLQEVLKVQAQVTGTTGLVFLALQKTDGSVYTDTIDILNREE